ncbi:MAG: PAS domain-containing sensor histidine kinase [Patescibacteria group bacterium]
MDYQNLQPLPHSNGQILATPESTINSLSPAKKPSVRTKYKLLLIMGLSFSAIALLSIYLYLSLNSLNLAITYFVIGLVVSVILNTAVAILLLSNSTYEPKESYAGWEEKFQETANALVRKSEELEIIRQKGEDLERKAFMNRAEAAATLTSIGEGVVVTNPEGKILIFNQAAEQMTHWTSSEVVGKFWFEIVPAIDENGKLIHRKDRDMYKALLTGKKVFAHSIYLQKGSTKVFVAVTATPIVFANQIIGAVEVFRNIGREIEVDRMKSEFISLASHQLRTPLSASKWFSEMLINGDAGQLNPEQKEYVENIFFSNERMIGLVNSLLNISRIESGRIIIDPKPTDINKLILEVINEIKVKSDRKKQHIIFSIHSELPQLNIDPLLIREVYVNLLTNASKYTPDGGEISIFVSKKDNELISQVSDTGYGILEKDYNKVFQKFYRGENIIKIETDGNGLGLYLIKAIIESSGGKIWFKSEVNKGTSFFFSIPVSGMQARIGEVSLNS